MFQQVVMRFATGHQLPSEGPHIVSTWTHRSSRQPWHCMCSSETNTTNPQLLLQSSGSTGTTKAGTAQIWARPSRREREHWRRALDAAGNSRDRSRLWTWMHATGKEKDPIRPYCCTQAIPWLGTRHCDKLSKSCSTHCTARACTKNNAKKNICITVRAQRLWVRQCNLRIHSNEAMPVWHFLAHTQQDVPKYSVPEPAAHIKTQIDQGCLQIPSSLVHAVFKYTPSNMWKPHSSRRSTSTKDKKKKRRRPKIRKSCSTAQFSQLAS